MKASPTIFRIALAGFTIISGLSANAEPGLIYQYGDNANIVGVKALVGIEAPMVAPGDNCDQRIADVVIDEVVYEGKSDIIAGFRSKKPAPNEWYGLFSIDYRAVYDTLPNATRSDVQKLIKKGAKLIVIYQVCGSGGQVTVRDIFKKTAINNL
jgi:hypothetical protein